MISNIFRTIVDTCYTININKIVVFETILSFNTPVKKLREHIAFYKLMGYTII